MKPQIYAVLIVAILATLACSVNVDLPEVNLPAMDKTGPTQTFNVDETYPPGSSTPADLTIKMGAGELNISPGATNLINGTIRYNIEEWQPKVTRNDSDITIEQEQIENLSIGSDIINEWELALNNTIPLSLLIQAGAYEGNLDLSGLHLLSLEITDGASQTTVEFNEPNPVEMTHLSYQTGASRVTLNGLANANFSEMTFDSGAGDYTLDFSGELLRDAQVNIRSGVSQVTIIVPAGMQVQVVNEGNLSNVDIDGTWTRQENTYTTTGEGPILSIEVEMGLGNLQLVQQ